MEQEQETKIKDLITKEQLLEQSGDLGQITAENVVLDRNNVTFAVDAFDEVEGISMSFLRENEKEIHHTLLTNTALHHLVREIGMPLTYANNTPDELVVPHLNYWYGEKMVGRKIRLLNQNGKTVAISLDPRDEFIPLQRFVDTIEQTIKPENIIGYHNPLFVWKNTWDATNINVVLKRNFAVVKDDLLNVGIRFTHSFNELNPTRAFAYIFRQWCSNGAITMDKIRCWSKRMKAESFKKWVPSVIVEAEKAFDLEEKRLMELTKLPTDEKTSDILDHLLAEGGVPLLVREAVRAEAIDQKTQTLYDVYNVITRVATHSDVFREHPASLPLLEQVASGLSFHSKLCPACHHKI